MKLMTHLVDGRRANVLELKLEDLDIKDVARRLSRITRFAGGGNRHRHGLPVGQHCAILSHLVPERLAKAALVHDVPETWYGDLTSPFKNLIGEPYFKVEADALIRLGEVLGIPAQDFIDIEPYDSKLAVDEAISLFSNSSRDPKDGFGLEIEPLAPHDAEVMWLTRWNELFPDLRQEF